jgi:hypothetical protein
MKKNMFGESILQPEDDIAAHFADTYSSDAEDITARDIDQDPAFGWTAILADGDLNEVQAHEFESREAIEAWLTSQGVRIQ